MVNLDLMAPEAMDAMHTGGSVTPTLQKWVPPEKREEITVAFVDVIDRAYISQMLDTAILLPLKVKN